MFNFLTRIPQRFKNTSPPKMSFTTSNLAAATPSLFNTPAPLFATGPLEEVQENTVLESKQLQDLLGDGYKDESTPTLNTVCVNERFVPFSELQTPIPVVVQNPGFLENDDDATPTLNGPSTVVNANFQRIIEIPESSSQKKITLCVDLSKNRLYQKRMERKRRDAWEKKNAKNKAAAESKK